MGATSCSTSSCLKTGFNEPCANTPAGTTRDNAINHIKVRANTLFIMLLLIYRKDNYDKLCNNGSLVLNLTILKPPLFFP
jgi:hypothetical protein